MTKRPGPAVGVCGWAGAAAGVVSLGAAWTLWELAATGRLPGNVPAADWPLLLPCALFAATLIGGPPGLLAAHIARAARTRRGAAWPARTAAALGGFLLVPVVLALLATAAVLVGLIDDVA